MNRVKGNYIKVLLALLVAIAPISLLTYHSSQVKADPQSPSSNQANNSDKLSKLKNARDNLKNSLEKFKEQIKTAAQKNDVQGINTQDVSTQINTLKQAKDEFLKSPPSNPDISQQIDSQIKKISEVIEPLKEGLDKKDQVENVQKYLESYSKKAGEFQGGYGTFGSLTQEAIGQFLTQEFDQLDKLINQLQPQKTENLTSNQTSSSESGNKKTASENINWVSIIVSALLGGIVGSLASIFGLEFLRKRSRTNRQATPPKTQNVASSSRATESANTQYFQTAFNNLTAKVNSDAGKIQNLESQLSRLQNDLRIISQSPSSSVSSPDWYQNPTPPIYQNQTFPEPTYQEAYPEANYGISTPQTPQLVDLYNHNPRSLSGKAIEVGETEESINNRRLSGNQLAILENKRGGSYWIIKEDSIDYMLPKQNLKINEYNYSTVEVLFECRNYYPNYSEYKLVKPAIVQIVSGGVWQFQERGVLEFY
jgi:hypothetical protein